MWKNKRVRETLLLLASVAAGVALGLAKSPVAASVCQGIADLFARLLKLVGVPVLFLAVVSTISGMRNLSEMRLFGKKVIKYTLLTTVLAAIVALGFFAAVRPDAAPFVAGAVATNVAPQGSYAQFLMQAVPSNFFGAFVEGNVLAVAFLALAISGATLFLPEEQKRFLNRLFTALFGVFLKLTKAVVVAMPLGIVAFAALLTKELSSHASHGGGLMLYLACILGANVVQGLVVLPALLKAKGVPPLMAARSFFPALALAFFSKSSNATLPVTLRCAEERLPVPSKTASLVLPLCTVINMNGCAAFILVTVLFALGAHGVPLHVGDYALWVLLATIAAIGNAGVPMGCYFLTSTFLASMGMPLYLMGLILPFYSLLDMVETALNVWSDACVTLMVDQDLKREEAIADAV